jgi:hypothetical protein
MGLGTFSPGVLARTTIYRSSNSNAAVSWSAGTRNLIVAPLGVVLESLFTPGSTGYPLRTADNTWSYTAASALAPAASPAFTGTVTLPDSSTVTSSGLGSLKALGVNEAAPSAGNINISGQYQVAGSQIAAANLSDYGAAQSWTPTFGGFSSPPTGGNAFYIKVGKLVLAYLNSFGAGTSNATTKTVTLPVAARQAVVMAGVGHAMDNGSFSNSPCRLDTRAGSTTCDVYKDLNVDAWTASGASVFDFALVYEAQ